MAKRFTDTDIWKSQRWFRKLRPDYKLAFAYIKDQCNHAGAWKIDCSDLTEDLGLDNFDLSDFINSVNTEFDPSTGKKTKKDRILLGKRNFLVLTGFVQFQYEGKHKKVNPATAPVRTALLFLQSIDILDILIDKGYVSLSEPLREGWQRPKDKDKDKDKDIVIENEAHEEKDIFRLNGFKGVGLAPDMLKAFKTVYPFYPVDEQQDLTACLQIAYKIAKQKGWQKDSVLKENLKDTLDAWDKIISFSTNDKWYATRSISDFNREFQRIVQGMTQNKKTKQATQSQEFNSAPPLKRLSAS